MIYQQEEIVAAQSRNAIVSGANGVDDRIELRCAVSDSGDDGDAKFLGDNNKGVVDKEWHKCHACQTNGYFGERVWSRMC